MAICQMAAAGIRPCFTEKYSVVCSQVMRPSETCHIYLGVERLHEIVDAFSSPQIKAVLKEGGLKIKASGGFVTQKKRRAIWGKKILGAVQGGNDEAASELLQQWLLNHERAILVDYLDGLGVKHRAGETDDSFLFSKPADLLREQGVRLFERHPAHVVATYLDYIAFQQKSKVFDDWGPLAAARLDSAPPASSAKPATVEEIIARGADD